MVRIGEKPTGTTRFPYPFLFPSGVQCHCLDELLRACEASWNEAQDLLQRGELASFFAELGWADLAEAARRAARWSDPDRGLEELLAKLPISTRKPTRLALGIREVLLVALTLLLCLLGVVGASARRPAPAQAAQSGHGPKPLPPTPSQGKTDGQSVPQRGGVGEGLGTGLSSPQEQFLDFRPRILLGFSPAGFFSWIDTSRRFGLTALDSGPEKGIQLLTYSSAGITNNTVVMLDGQEARYEVGPLSRWKQPESRLRNTPDSVQGRESLWVCDRDQVEILQRVEVVRGIQSQMLDTCLIRYRMTNHDRLPHQVGLRFMLDTFIGSNDGVPFLIPGSAALCSTHKDFTQAAAVPAFLQACERNDLNNPGTIAQVGLKVNGLEPPSRVSLTAWPGGGARWEVPLRDIGLDSCVVLYWSPQILEPGQTREVGFSYGLGQVLSAEARGKLGVVIGGSFVPGGDFLVTAYVGPSPLRQTVTLHLPEGFKLVEGSQGQALPPSPEGSTSNRPVTWKVRGPLTEGPYTLRVDSSLGVSQTQPVAISTRGLFRQR